ncbi:thymidine phosphorylase [Azospirillum halopraeferens]|uniref:thymidine phosphorylase n=1 Tax=Azospirillum halopraeferens TaxID=34010 RepID=UPI00040C2804|nr:thymidine phosphorylase [Azospirillum halopraeferens]
MFLPQETIRRKRDGHRLEPAEIEAFVRGITDGSVGEGQAAAFAMAVFFRGMRLDERVALTRAMTRSGTVLDWAPLGLPGPVVDKHSTGGVGDKVSLILAPAVAACGGFVPMVSGRGLGHTGGTLDKFDSIPGYRSLPDRATLQRVVREAGCAVIGATPDIAPADRRLYAIRDVTATVESLDLITASILSKKLAAGLDALVMDVKFGSGAFMATPADAEALAESIVTVAAGAGLPAVALLTDMNRVLGHSAGNALEMREAIAILRGEPADARLLAVTAELSAELLVLAGLAADVAEGRRRFADALAGGAAAERFARMVRALGGPADLLDAPDRHLAVAPVRRPVTADRDGVVAAVDTRALGVAVVGLGGGRVRVHDAIDPAVGLDAVAGPGDAVGPRGRPLAVVHARSDADADAAAAVVRAAVTVADTAPPAGPVVARRI